MKKQTGLGLIALFLILTTYVACEKDKLIVSQPTIIASNTSPREYDEIGLKVEEYAELDGNKVKAETFTWTIEDSLGNVVKNDFADSAAIVWIPEESGFYNVRVEVAYSDNDRVLADSEIFISESELNFSSYFNFQNSIPIIVNEEIEINVIESAYRNSQRLMPERLIWAILDSMGNIVKDNFDQDKKRISWISEVAGEYLITLRIEYDNNIVETLSKTVSVFEKCPNYIVQAELVVGNEYPLFKNEEIIINVIENASCNDQRVLPESFIWTVKDSLGSIVEDNFSIESASLSWIPEETGFYTVSLRLEYDKNIIETIDKSIIVVETDPRLPYLGDYHFTRILTTWLMNEQIGPDTTFYDGFVHADPENKKSVIIKCGESGKPNAITYDYYSVELLFKEESIHPVFELREYGGRGRFTGFDKLNFEDFVNPLGGGQLVKISGTKIQ